MNSQACVPCELLTALGQWGLPWQLLYVVGEPGEGDEMMRPLRGWRGLCPLQERIPGSQDCSSQLRKPGRVLKPRTLLGLFFFFFS